MVEPVLSRRLHGVTTCGLLPFLRESFTIVARWCHFSKSCAAHNVVATVFNTAGGCLNFKTMWSLKEINENTSSFYYFTIMSFTFSFTRLLKSNSIPSINQLSASI